MSVSAEHLRHWPASVRVRVTGAAVLLIGAALAIAAITAVGLLHRSLASDYDSLLVDRVDEVELLARNGDLEPLIAATDKETGQLQVVNSDRQVVAATTGMAQTARLDVIAAPTMGRQLTSTVDGSKIGGQAGEPFRLVVRTVPSAAGPLTIYGVTSLRAERRAEHHLTRVLEVGLPLLLLFAALLIWWVVGRALAPVDEMRRLVDQIEGSDLDERVDVRDRRDEIGRLGNTLNRMLARVQEATDRQRVFAAAASHELRSPLSAIRTELEVGLTYPDQTDWKVVANESLVEVERLEHLARDLTQLTRLHAGATTQTSGPCDLAELVRAELSRRGQVSGISHRTMLRPAVISAPRDSIVRLLRNLLDNAERHATSDIVVMTATGAERVTLSVANDGPPIAPQDRERIFDAFTRLDDARVLDNGGSGLGLAIARGLVESLGGTLAVADVETGAAFEAAFPTQ